MNFDNEGLVSLTDTQDYRFVVRDKALKYGLTKDDIVLRIVRRVDELTATLINHPDQSRYLISDIEMLLDLLDPK